MASDVNPRESHQERCPECRGRGTRMGEHTTCGPTCGRWHGYGVCPRCKGRKTVPPAERDEAVQRAQQASYDNGWEAAWEIVTGGTAVELPWPERVRLVKRICEAVHVEWVDTGTALIAYLGQSIPDAEQTATCLPVPEYEELR